MFARLVLVSAGLVLGVATLEVCLQAAASWNAARKRDAPASPLTAARRVVCLGDSNTYGLYVDRGQAYPSLLRDLWNGGPDRGRVDVVNLGYPGSNSSALRNQLPHVLEVHHPDVVMIMVGANDLWTVPEPVPGEPAAARYYRIWHFSRVYRLVSMLWQAVQERSVGEQLSPDAPLAAVPPSGASRGWSYALQRNLEDMVARVKQANAEPILLTYPSDEEAYGDANRVIRSTAQSDGIRLIDLTPTFRDRCPGWKCRELFPDQHPTPEGHALMAHTIAGRLAGPGPTPAEP